jgi:four helix bundle suffix protein
MNCWLRLTPVRVYFWNDLRHDITATLCAPTGLPNGRLSLFTPGAFGSSTARPRIENRDPAICVNVIVGLIKVTCYLLDQQLRRLEEDFLREGGLRAHGSCSARRSRQTAATPMTSPCRPFCPSGR